MSDIAKETTEYWQNRLKRQHTASQREKREFEKLRARMRDWEDLRDDIVSIALNSGKSEEQIQMEGGPVVRTQQNYKLRITKQPSLPTALAYLRACGKELTFRDIQPKVEAPTPTPTIKKTVKKRAR